MDNEFDQRLLNTFLERLFTTRSFDSEFKLACKVDGHKDIQMPDGIRYGCLWGQKSWQREHLEPVCPTLDSKCPAFSGERSSCSGWSCCLMPRRPRGWACPTMPRGSCLPPKVGRESLHSSRTCRGGRLHLWKGAERWLYFQVGSTDRGLVGRHTDLCPSLGKGRKTRVQHLLYTACPRLRLRETGP